MLSSNYFKLQMGKKAFQTLAIVLLAHENSNSHAIFSLFFLFQNSTQLFILLFISPLCFGKPHKYLKEYRLKLNITHHLRLGGKQPHLSPFHQPLLFPLPAAYNWFCLSIENAIINIYHSTYFLTRYCVCGGAGQDNRGKERLEGISQFLYTWGCPHGTLEFGVASRSPLMHM